jgi:hypothetical protein
MRVDLLRLVQRSRSAVLVLTVGRSWLVHAADEIERYERLPRNLPGVGVRAAVDSWSMGFGMGREELPDGAGGVQGGGGWVGQAPGAAGVAGGSGPLVACSGDRDERYASSLGGSSPSMW